MTSAFALGFNQTLYCKNATPCSVTAPIPYFNSTSTAPFTDFGIRPAMLLAGWSIPAVLRTIHAGVAADGTRPGGVGYMYLTHDHVRSCRAPEFAATVAEMRGKLNVELVNCSARQCVDYLENASDVLTYFTGLTTVPELSTNHFVPGAVGDHLTSYGGILTNTSSQMPCIEFLAAGATGSYGTVVEPCAFLQKFPDPSVMLPRYYGGDTLIESYWKSVLWPGEGLFVGEPLANPYKVDQPQATATLNSDGAMVTISATLPPGDHTVVGCRGREGTDCRGPRALLERVTVPTPNDGERVGVTQLKLPRPTGVDGYLILPGASTNTQESTDLHHGPQQLSARPLTESKK